jgi:hypothetical protein
MVRIFLVCYWANRGKCVATNLLERLPLLSDQGVALSALVDHLRLVWKHCPRHLIENAGASTLTGESMRQLLQCPSLSEAQALAARIEHEILAVFGDMTPAYYQPDKGKLIGARVDPRETQ